MENESIKEGFYFLLDVRETVFYLFACFFPRHDVICWFVMFHLCTEKVFSWDSRRFEA